MCILRNDQFLPFKTINNDISDGLVLLVAHNRSKSVSTEASINPFSYVAFHPRNSYHLRKLRWGPLIWLRQSSKWYTRKSCLYQIVLKVWLKSKSSMTIFSARRILFVVTTKEHDTRIWKEIRSFSTISHPFSGKFLHDDLDIKLLAVSIWILVFELWSLDAFWSRMTADGWNVLIRNIRYLYHRHKFISLSPTNYFCVLACIPWLLLRLRMPEMWYHQTEPSIISISLGFNFKCQYLNRLELYSVPFQDHKRNRYHHLCLLLFMVFLS